MHFEGKVRMEWLQHEGCRGRNHRKPSIGCSMGDEGPTMWTRPRRPILRCCRFVGPSWNIAPDGWVLVFSTTAAPVPRLTFEHVEQSLGLVLPDQETSERNALFGPWVGGFSPSGVAHLRH
jgi:hypothetical protein